MDYHKNARLTVFSRAALAKRVVEEGLTLKLAAASFNVSEKTASKWAERYREEGLAGMAGRSSRPHRLRCPTPEVKVEEVVALRRQRATGYRIASQSRLSRATVCRILRRCKLNRMRDLEPPPGIVRYERDAPGDMIHMDIKRLVRIARPSHRVTGDRRDRVAGIGAEYVHIAIDDHSRLAFAAIYPDQTRASVVLFTGAALAFFKACGIDAKRMMTDNGGSYRSHAFRERLAELGIKHKRTKPYRPQPTARPNDSSKPLSENGPTPAHTKTQPNENNTSCPSSTTTTGTDHTWAFNSKHPSAD